LSKIIIGIHGLGNKPPKHLLKRWWRKSIREGVSRIGYPRLAIPFELVYWSKHLHPDHLNPKEKDTKNPFYLDSPYRPSPSKHHPKPSPFRKRLLNVLERQIDKLLLNEDMSINFSAVTDLIIHHFFKDLDAYYSHKIKGTQRETRPARDIIREDLIEVLQKHRKKNICLIAHSMGSIIAYDVLTRCVPDIQIDTLITIGSPLSIPVVIHKYLGETNPKYQQKVVYTPENVVNHWYNLSDLQDKISMNYTLADDYKPNKKHVHVVDKVVYNDYEIREERNPHKSYGYLRTPEMAEIIHAFLKFKWKRWFQSIKKNLLG